MRLAILIVGLLLVSCRFNDVPNGTFKGRYVVVHGTEPLCHVASAGDTAVIYGDTYDRNLSATVAGDTVVLVFNDGIDTAYDTAYIGMRDTAQGWFRKWVVRKARIESLSMDFFFDSSALVCIQMPEKVGDWVSTFERDVFFKGKFRVASDKEEYRRYRRFDSIFRRPEN